MNTMMCNDCLSLFNIILIAIEKKKETKCEESANCITSRQFPIMKKHEHLIEKKRLDNTIDLLKRTREREEEEKRKEK